MREIPTVSAYMTRSPISIDAAAAIREADTLMSINGFRHLPVVRDGEAIGILNDQDLKLARGLHGVDAEATQVDAIARQDLYAVAPEAPLDEVVRTMAERRICSAVVITEGKIVGIFTTTDALDALAAILKE